MSDRCRVCVWVPLKYYVNTDGSADEDKKAEMAEALEARWGRDICRDGDFVVVEYDEESYGGSERMGALQGTAIPYVMANGRGHEYTQGLVIRPHTVTHEVNVLELGFDGQLVAGVALNNGACTVDEGDLVAIGAMADYARVFAELWGTPNCDVFKELLK